MYAIWQDEVLCCQLYDKCALSSIMQTSYSWESDQHKKEHMQTRKVCRDGIIQKEQFSEPDSDRNFIEITQNLIGSDY